MNKDIKDLLKYWGIIILMILVILFYAGLTKLNVLTALIEVLIVSIGFEIGLLILIKAKGEKK